MARDHQRIIDVAGSYHGLISLIEERATDASTDIGGLDDNKPDARAVAKLNTEIDRLRGALVTEHTAMLAAIDA